MRREWAALESEHQRLGDWHTRLEGRTKAEASHAARVLSELKADQESYRANLRKVFDREVAVASREKALAQREVAFAKEAASLAAQWSELESRGQGLEVRKLELDKLSETLQGWREQLQETASKQAVAELELEEDRKSLAKRESLTTNMELQLERQCEALKSLKESPGGGGQGSTGRPGAGGGLEAAGGPAQEGSAGRRLGERSELSTGAAWIEPNPSGRATSLDC